MNPLAARQHLRMSQDRLLEEILEGKVGLDDWCAKEVSEYLAPVLDQKPSSSWNETLAFFKRGFLEGDFVLHINRRSVEDYGIHKTERDEESTNDRDAMIRDTHERVIGIEKMVSVMLQKCIVSEASNQKKESLLIQLMSRVANIERSGMKKGGGK